jgi:hypothetical protein
MGGLLFYTSGKAWIFASHHGTAGKNIRDPCFVVKDRNRYAKYATKSVC